MTRMDRDSELALVARLRAGDPAAFDVLHEEFNTRFFNFLARLSPRRDVAEDLLEETWLRLVAYAPALRVDTQLAAWLFTVARNRYATYCRARQVENSHAALRAYRRCGFAEAPYVIMSRPVNDTTNPCHRGSPPWTTTARYSPISLLPSPTGRRRRCAAPRRAFRIFPQDTRSARRWKSCGI